MTTMTTTSERECQHDIDQRVPTFDPTGIDAEAVAVERAELIRFGWREGPQGWSGCVCGTIWRSDDGDSAPRFLAAARWGGGWVPQSAGSYRRVRESLYRSLGCRPECECGEGERHPADVRVRWVPEAQRNSFTAQCTAWINVAVLRYFALDCLARERCLSHAATDCGNSSCAEHGSGECPWVMVGH